MTELRALLREHHDAGLSYEAMAVRARHEGFRIDKQYFQQVAVGRIQRPSAGRLAAIAAGLPGVTERTVREAAARTAGIHVEHNIDYRTSQLLSFVDEMSPASRDRWHRLAKAIAVELAAEESVAPQTVVMHADDAPNELTRRVLEREFEDAAGNIVPRERRRQDP